MHVNINRKNSSAKIITVLLVLQVEQPLNNNTSYVYRTYMYLKVQTKQSLFNINSTTTTISITTKVKDLFDYKQSNCYYFS